MAKLRSAGRADEARLLVHREADRANTDALLHQLHADPSLFEAAAPEAL